MSLETLFSEMQEGAIQDLNLVIKADVVIPAGVKLARFSIFQGDTTGNDLDLFVYQCSDPSCTTRT